MINSLIFRSNLLMLKRMGDLEYGDGSAGLCNLENWNVKPFVKGDLRKKQKQYVSNQQKIQLVTRESFYDVFGNLFFLGIMLSIVFLLAAVQIIYYKQISEGYENHGRFEIMQKVGMTKRDIRKSINSQMLTVFFMPLIFAGIHLTFAIPFIFKILMLFAMDNITQTAIVNLICFVVFGFYYAIVYKITLNFYYTIVSGRKEQRL